MNRRSVLRAIVYSATTGCLLGGITPTATLAAMGEPYATAVGKAQDLLPMSRAFWARRTEGPMPEDLVALRARMTEATDDLLAYLLDRFEPTASPTEVVEAFRRAPAMDALDERHLMTLSAGVVPVAIMRELLRTHKLVVDVPALTHWKAFTSRYYDAVMAA